MRAESIDRLIKRNLLLSLAGSDPDAASVDVERSDAAPDEFNPACGDELRDRADARRDWRHDAFLQPDPLQELIVRIDHNDPQSLFPSPKPQRSH
jgi:hypothetical protein